LETRAEFGAAPLRHSWRRSALVVAVAGALLGIGCEDSVSGVAPSGSAPAFESATTVRSAISSTPPLPEAGSATFRFEEGRLSVAANAAPRLPLFERLAEAAEFALETDGGDWPLLTVRFDDLVLAQALPRLVGDLTYRAEWVAEKGGGPHRLASLVVGERVAETRSPASERAERHKPGVAPATEARAAVAEPLRDRRATVVGAAVTEALRDRWVSDESELEAHELLAGLDDPDPEIRLRAAIEIEPEGDALDRLAGLLENDPDPRVRAATAANLESAESYGAVEALVVALDDPDPDFVLAVIDSLEFAGDASNVWHLEPLLEHPDPRVREAAADAIDFLGN
jgi:hypothetical protein